MEWALQMIRRSFAAPRPGDARRAHRHAWIFRVETNLAIVARGGESGGELPSRAQRVLTDATALFSR